MSRLRDIARRAVPYGLPTVRLHQELVGLSGAGRGPAGSDVLHHESDEGRVRHAAVLPPAAETLHSYAWLDLRTGPVLLSLPRHRRDRSMSAVIIDLYSSVVGHVPPRATARSAVSWLVRGPSSSAPDLVVDDVVYCPTDLCLLVVRTGIRREDDLAEVTALQHAVTVQPLGPPAAPLLPPDAVDVREPPGTPFLRSLDWMLALMPRLPEDYEVRGELTELGCGTGQVDAVVSDPRSRSEIIEGLRLGHDDVVRRATAPRAVAELSSPLEHHDHLARAAAAYLGIIGVVADEVGTADHGAGAHPRERAGDDLA